MNQIFKQQEKQSETCVNSQGLLHTCTSVDPLKAKIEMN